MVAERGKAPKDPVLAREKGVDLLETRQEEQEQELDDALGGGGSNRSGGHGRGHGRGRGRGRGRGHGCGCGHGRGGGRGNQEVTLVIEDLEAVDALDADGHNEAVSRLFIQSRKADQYSRN